MKRRMELISWAESTRIGFANRGRVVAYWAAALAVAVSVVVLRHPYWSWVAPLVLVAGSYFWTCHVARRERKADGP